MKQGQTIPTDRAGQEAMYAEAFGARPRIVAAPQGVQRMKHAATGVWMLGPYQCPVCEGTGWFSLINNVRCAICDGIGQVCVPEGEAS